MVNPQTVKPQPGSDSTTHTDNLRQQTAQSLQSLQGFSVTAKDLTPVLEQEVIPGSPTETAQNFLVGNEDEPANHWLKILGQRIKKMLKPNQKVVLGEKK